MNNKFGVRNSEFGIATQGGRGKAEGGFVISFRNPQSAIRIRPAMTLIELMVVIVILVTLVAGVLPLVSPNNDSRKIAETSRMLQTYFMQAQAEAARIGRPVGIGFRESTVDSGVALEAFQMVVPPPYPGSSQLSRVNVTGLPLETHPESPWLYGQVDNGNQSTRFLDYVGARLYAVTSQLALRDDVRNTIPDPLPPKMFQVGDIIEVQGNRFVIIDDERNQVELLGNNIGFLNPSAYAAPYKNTLICVRLEEVMEGTKASPLAVPPNGYSYAIHRQPMGNERNNASPNERIITSGESPMQFPAGVAIDLMSSGLEAGEMATVVDLPRPTSASMFGVGSKPLPYSAGVMFSPNGGIDSFWINGQRLTNVSRVFFLIGRVENGNPDVTLFTDWERGAGGTTELMSDDEFRDRKSKVNWLNPDSRWLLINANDGRLSVGQNANVDPRNDAELRPSQGSLTDKEFAVLNLKLQIEAAHELAHGGHGDREQ